MVGKEGERWVGGWVAGRVGGWAGGWLGGWVAGWGAGWVFWRGWMAEDVGTDHFVALHFSPLMTGQPACSDL